MADAAHGFKIDQEKCRGCLSCMRVCPTHAIRVKRFKAQHRLDQCIDCGLCLPVCPDNAISATTCSVADLDRYRFKVAVPCPVLFGQFPTGITPAQIVEGLLAVGFDAVWDYSVEIALVARAIRDYLEQWTGPTPLISVSCPVVVRLVQVAYPRMVEQLIPIQIPRELAGREAKRRYSAQLGLHEDDIAAIYITPCQAKTISILQPAEGVVSNLDGAMAITDVYNAILAYGKAQGVDAGRDSRRDLIRNSSLLREHVSEGLGRLDQNPRYLLVTGLANTIQVFDDIEKGRLRNVGFLEAHSCWSGCSGGNLTVANVYVTRTKFHALMRTLPQTDPETDAELSRRYPHEDFSLAAPIRPRPIRGRTGTLRQRVQMVQLAESTLASLPGLDCGLCGAPTCKELAKDVSTGDAGKTDCVFFSKTRLDELRAAYVRPQRHE